MKNTTFKKDIKVYCIQAGSFPNGVMEAFNKLHSLIEVPPKRRIFGISRHEHGYIVYRAGAEEREKGDLSKHNLIEFTIPKGKYIGIEIKNYRNDMTLIKKAFDLLLAHPNIDPNGYCIEEYKGTSDVYCLVRLHDKKKESK